jgi:1,4-alpha-glucan branching enzyme
MVLSNQLEKTTMLKKKFLKTKCKVTFELPTSLTDGAETVYLVGEFNNWDERATPMDKELVRKTTRFTITLDLDLNKDYQYRYLVNGKKWENDWHADKYVTNPFTGDNSVVSTDPSKDTAADDTSK